MLGAKWQWVDWDRRVIDLPDSKTGAKQIYLSDAALGVLRTLYGRHDRGTSDYIIKGRHRVQTPGEDRNRAAVSVIGWVHDVLVIKGQSGPFVEPVGIVCLQ